MTTGDADVARFAARLPERERPGFLAIVRNVQAEAFANGLWQAELNLQNRIMANEFLREHFAGAILRQYREPQRPNEGMMT